MTRLKTEWINDLVDNITDNEKKLKDLTGLNFLEFASRANGLPSDKIIEAAKSELVAVVPFTAGLGVINRFSESVAAIVRQAGFDAFVTQKTDADGLYESRRRNATIVFFADDKRYLGWHFKKDRVSDNNISTARGYVEALEFATGGLKDKKTLVIGCGVVGFEIIKHLKTKNAIPVIFDKNDALKWQLAEKLKTSVIADYESIKEFQLILDATSQGQWLHKGMLHDEAWIAAPGIPLSLDDETHEIYGKRLIHDQLEIGTLTMLGNLFRK